MVSCAVAAKQAKYHRVTYEVSRTQAALARQIAIRRAPGTVMRRTGAIRQVALHEG